MVVTNEGGRRRETRRVSLLLKLTQKWLLQERRESFLKSVHLKFKEPILKNKKYLAPNLYLLVL
jgi:hypothetical protein